MSFQSVLLSNESRERLDVPIVLAAGFLGTLAMTTIMYVLPLLHLGQVDTPLWIARLVITDPIAAAATGLAIHSFLGFVFAWVFARHVEPRLSVGPIRAGLTYGTILWLFAQAVAVPTLGAVAASIHANAVSPGWIAARLGLVAALASLVAHLAYGSVLGFVYGCLFRARCLQTIR